MTGLDIPSGELNSASVLNLWRDQVASAPHLRHQSAIPRAKTVLIGYGVAGIGGVWTRVPEPSTLVLLGVGLLGLVFASLNKLSRQAR